MVDGFLTVTRNGKTFKRPKVLPRMQVKLKNGRVLLGDMVASDPSFVELFWMEDQVGVQATVLRENIASMKSMKVDSDTVYVD